MDEEMDCVLIGDEFNGSFELKPPEISNAILDEMPNLQKQFQKDCVRTIIYFDNEQYPLYENYKEHAESKRSNDATISKLLGLCTQSSLVEIFSNVSESINSKMNEPGCHVVAGRDSGDIRIDVKFDVDDDDHIIHIMYVTKCNIVDDNGVVIGKIVVKHNIMFYNNDIDDVSIARYETYV
jgi:hypothetical protein